DELRQMSERSDETVPRILNLDTPSESKRDKNATRLCEMLKTYGFLGQNLVGYDGVAAAFSLLTYFANADEQMAMMPIVDAAIAKKELPKDEGYAAFIDRLRIRKGMRQLFGTQAFVRDDLLVLWPIE